MYSISRHIYIQSSPRYRSVVTVIIISCAAAALCFGVILQLQEESRLPSMHLTEGENNGRKLEWKVAGENEYQVVWNDKWYSQYKKHETPDDVYKEVGEPDYLRPSDKCPGKDESYSRQNCPTVPDCSKVEKKWGNAKLCINRVPLPFDNDNFYVGAMKCIPHWETCNRCICGAMADGKDGKCIFDLHDALDDDRIKVDCSDLSEVSFGKKKFKPFDTNEPTHSPSMESLSPSHKPTSTPTSSSVPSSIPTSNPTKLFSPSPSILPSSKPSNLRTISPSATLTQTPSLTPSNTPSQVPSRAPTNVPSQIPSSSVSKLPSFALSSKPTVFPSSSPSEPQLKPDFLSLTPSISPSNRKNDFKFFVNRKRKNPNNTKESYGVITLFAVMFVIGCFSIYIIGIRWLAKNNHKPYDEVQSDTSDLTF